MDPAAARKVLNLDKLWNFGGDADQCARNGFGKERWDNKVVQKYQEEEEEEKYQGNFREDCLHGNGNYNWGQICYEGKFYADNINGYGVMSYPNGSFFEGLYKQSQRFGPGVLTYSNSSQDVGLWIGHQLIRLALNITESKVPSIAKTFKAKAYINKYRKLIPVSKSKSAPHLLLEKISNNKRQEPITNFRNLCNKYVRNQDSFFFDLISFDEAYFSDQKVPVIKNINSSQPILVEEIVTDLLSWNNEKDQMDLRKHIFDHRNLEHGLSYDVEYTLGERDQFGSIGSLENLWKKLFTSICNLENFNKSIIMEHDLNADTCDCLGNTAVHCAVAYDNLQALKSLVDLGANLDRLNDECLTPLIIILLRFLATKNDVTDWQKAFLPPVENSDNLDSYILDCSIHVVAFPQKKKKEKRKKEKKEKKVKEMKGKKSKKGNVTSSPTPTAVELIEDLRPKSILFCIFHTLTKLLEYGADPNFGEVPHPPIFLALFTLEESVLLNLIKHNADVNARTSQEDGYLTPLHVIALMKPHPDLHKFVRILVDNNALPNLRSNVIHWVEEKSKISSNETCIDEGKTALHILSMRYDFLEDETDLLGTLYEIFVQSGFDPNLFYLGHNCLSLAVLRGNVRLIRRILVREDADPNQHLGCEMGVPLTVLLLKRYKNVLPLYAGQEVLETLIQNGANPLKFVPNSDQLQINSIDFCEMENQPEPSRKPGKKVKINKKEPHYKLIQFYHKIAQSVLERRNMAKMVEYLYIYRILCSICDPIFDRYAKMLDLQETLRILQIFINHNHIPVVKEALVDLLEFIAKPLHKRKSSRSPTSPKNKKSSGGKSSKKEDNFQDMIQHILDEKNVRAPKKFGVCEPEIDPFQEKYKVCYNCLKKFGKDLILCPDCELFYFCSLECNNNNLKKNTKHKCTSLFYAMEQGKIQANQKGQSILEQLEGKRQTLLQNPFSEVRQKYYPDLQSDQSFKVKFALPDLPKTAKLPSKESKLFEIVAALDKKEHRKSLEASSSGKLSTHFSCYTSQLSQKGSKVSTKKLSTFESSRKDFLKDRQGGSSEIHSSKTKKSQRLNVENKTIKSSREVKTSSRDEKLNKLGIRTDKDGFQYHKSRKEHEEIAMKELTVCDAEICEVTNKDRKEAKYKTKRKYSKINTGSRTDGLNQNEAIHLKAPPSDKVLARSKDKQRATTPKIRTKLIIKDRNGSQNHIVVTTDNETKPNSRKYVDNKTTTTDRSHGKFSSSLEDSSRKRVNVELFKGKASVSSSGKRENQGRYSKVKTEVTQSKFKYSTGKNKETSFQTKPKQQTGSIHKPPRRTIQDSKTVAQDRQQRKTASSNSTRGFIEPLTLKGKRAIRDSTAVAKYHQHHEADSPRSANSKENFGLRLGDKLKMTPILVHDLSLILNNQKGALQCATLINGQLYYIFKKYKAYTDVQCNNNNFSYM